jgi:DNA-binding SARP family transcriptional activator
MIRVLGSIEIEQSDGSTVAIRNASRRRMLALLASCRGQTVPVERLVDACGITSAGVRTGICRIRNQLDEHVLETVAPGYQLSSDACDVSIAERRLRAIDRSDPSVAIPELCEVIAMWHGRAFDEFACEQWAEPEAVRLDELRAGAIEDLAELLISAGRADEAVGRLRAHIVDEPFRDRSRQLLMLALHGTGRTTEALRAYQDYRTFLAEEVGGEPSATTRRLDSAIASGCLEPGTTLPRVGARWPAS